MGDGDAYKAQLQQFTARFGENVRRARLAQDPPCSQEQLAVRAQLHRTEISRIEQGLVEPRLTTLVVLSQGLGVTLDALVDGLSVPAERRPSPTGSGSPPATS